MNASLSLALILAIVWGVVWAATLQFTTWGRWLAVRRTWITVVVGVAGVGLIALLVAGFGSAPMRKSPVAWYATGLTNQPDTHKDNTRWQR